MPNPKSMSLSSLLKSISASSLLALLLLSLTFRTWSYLDEYFLRILSPITQFVRENGYVVSGWLLTVTIITLTLFVPRNRFRFFWTPMYIHLVPVFIFRLKLYFENQELVNMLLSIILILAVIVCFGACIPSVIRTEILTAYSVNCVLFWAGTMWALVSLWEWNYNAGGVIWQDRFLGISGHPNHAGLVVGVACAACTGVMLVAETKRAKVFYGLGAAFLLGMTIWTGSRTAAVVLACAWGAMLLERKLAILLTAVVLSGILWLVVSESDLRVTTAADDVRAISTENTRIGAWESLWGAFSQNMLLGGSRDIVGSENSILLVLARTGLTGGIPFLLSFSLILREAYFLMGRCSSAHWFSSEKTAGAIILGIMVGGVFEGYLKDEFSFPIFALYLLLAVGRATKAARLFPTAQRQGTG
jgi:hypothetical protein